MSTKTIFLLVCMSPFICNGQVDNAVIKLLKDKESLYVDSSIMYVTDTNKTNRALQPHGVWRRRGTTSNSNYSITSYFDGRLHGHSIVFFPNGNIATSSYNYFNQPHGPFLSFWPNGNPYEIKFYQWGKLDGIYKEFDSSGVFKRITEYKNDKKDGLEILFYPSGNVQVIATYKDDKEVGTRRGYKDNERMEIISEEKIDR
jgi:antitoxin component YwqK of YwqJK toxin-antitoxin module